MKIYQLYVVTVKSEKYNHEETGAYTSLYEAQQFAKSCLRCAWGEDAEVTIDITTF